MQLFPWQRWDTMLWSTKVYSKDAGTVHVLQ
jgi:hypothetical protein